MTNMVKSLALCIFLVLAMGVSSLAHAQDYPLIPEITPVDRFTPDIEAFQILYAPHMIVLTSEASQRLDRLAVRLKGTRDKISIIAYSGDAQLLTHEAVKLSFKRALLIRILLLDQGVEPEQIELRALSHATDGRTPYRVGIAPVSRLAACAVWSWPASIEIRTPNGGKGCIIPRWWCRV